MRTFVIGDIHGNFNQLKSLIRGVGIQPEDTLVTLGDYIDRGPDSKKVIDFLCHYDGNLIPIKGNHEDMALHSRHNRKALVAWMENGGESTLKSYEVMFDLAEIPALHWQFMESCRDFYDGGNFFCCHGSAAPHTKLEDQKWELLRWLHLDKDNLPNWRPKLMICGHTPQFSGNPLFSDKHGVVCIDTGSFKTGWLTCLEAETGQFWQAGEGTAFRTGKLY